MRNTTSRTISVTVVAPMPAASDTTATSAATGVVAMLRDRAAQVLAQLVEPEQAPASWKCSVRRGDVAERAPGRVTCLVGRHRPPRSGVRFRGQCARGFRATKSFVAALLGGHSTRRIRILGSNASRSRGRRTPGGTGTNRRALRNAAVGTTADRRGRNSRLINSVLFRKPLKSRCDVHRSTAAATVQSIWHCEMECRPPIPLDLRTGRTSNPVG